MSVEQPNPTQISNTGDQAGVAKLPGLLEQRIGFLGAGQMAEALARGFVDKGVTTADKICCFDPWAVRNDVFKSFGAVPYSTNIEVAKNSEVIFIAVKPQYVGVVLEEIKHLITDKHIIVSIAAGIPIDNSRVSAKKAATYHYPTMCSGHLWR
eukprot:gene32364-5055_t